MRVIVVGASGGIGRLVVDRLVAEGHDVVAVLRRPAGGSARPNLRAAVVANLLDADALAREMDGANAVISTIGPRSLKDGPVTSTVTASIIAAMRRVAVGRIVAVSAAPVGEMPENETPLLRFVLRPLIWTLLGEHYRDLERTESQLAASGLIWTAMRPPRLSDGPPTGKVRLQLGGAVPGGFIVSRADVAAAMCSAVQDAATFNRPVGIAN